MNTPPNKPPHWLAKAYAENAGNEQPLEGEIIPPAPTKLDMLEEIYEAAKEKLPLRRAPEIITLTAQRK